MNGVTSLLLEALLVYTGNRGWTASVLEVCLVLSHLSVEA